MRLATGWRVRRTNPRGCELLPTRPCRLWGLPSLVYNEYMVPFVGVKRPERALITQPHLAPRLKEVLSYNYSPFFSPWPVLGSTLPLLHEDECSSWHTNQFVPADEDPTAHIKCEIGWPAEPESWKREKSPIHTRNLTMILRSSCMLAEAL